MASDNFDPSYSTHKDNRSHGPVSGDVWERARDVTDRASGMRQINIERDADHSVMYDKNPTPSYLKKSK